LGLIRLAGERSGPCKLSLPIEFSSQRMKKGEPSVKKAHKKSQHSLAFSFGD
jgi:hypothetical protein